MQKVNSLLMNSNDLYPKYIECALLYYTLINMRTIRCKDPAPAYEPSIGCIGMKEAEAKKKLFNE